MIRPSTLVLIATLICLSTELYARAGGGGGGGGGNGGNGGGFFGTLFYIFIAPFVLLYSAYESHKMSQRKKEIRLLLKQMEEIEPEWSEESLISFSKNRFLQIQNDWGYQDLNALSTKLSPELFRNWKEQIDTQRANNERELFEGLSINDVFIVDVKNYAKDELDKFTVCIDASGADKKIRNDKVIEVNSSAFREFWTFGRNGQSWQLLEITQAEGWERFVGSQIVFEKRIANRR